MSVEFLMTSLIIVVAPGTGVIYTIGIGLSRGARASLFAAVGCTIGIVPHLVAAILGLAALLQVNVLAFQIFKIAGVVYLLYLAWGILREKGALQIEAAGQTAPAWRIVATGFLINILNPKLSIFFLAFLPQFVSPGEITPIIQMVALGQVFMVMTLVVFIIYGAFAAVFSRQVISRPSVMTWLRRSFALAFVALGVRLALATSR